MHLDRLEKAGLVTGELELADDGKSRKYFSVVPFDVRLDIEAVYAALREPAEKPADSARSTKEKAT
jgi:predicted transcriptional regulator